MGKMSISSCRHGGLQAIDVGEKLEDVLRGRVALIHYSPLQFMPEIDKSYGIHLLPDMPMSHYK